MSHINEGNEDNLRKRIQTLEQKIAEELKKAKHNKAIGNKTMAIQNLRQKKRYEKLLENAVNNLNKSLRSNVEKVSQILSGNRTPEQRKKSRRRLDLKNKNGRVSEDSRNERMSGRPCFSNCEKKSWCDPRGWCDTNYYCTPSNRSGTEAEPGVKDQKCIPVHMKSQGGRKKRKTKRKLRKSRKTRRKKRGGMCGTCPGDKKKRRSRKRKSKRR